MADEVLLLLGTHKGVFLLKSSSSRDAWNVEGSFLKGYPVEYVIADQREETRLYASVTNPFYGPSLSVSQNFGKPGNLPKPVPVLTNHEDIRLSAFGLWNLDEQKRQVCSMQV